LQKAIVNQKLHEQSLQRREKELIQKELDLVEREIIVMLQQQELKPTPTKRAKAMKRKSIAKLHKNTQNIGRPEGIYRTAELFLISVWSNTPQLGICVNFI